MQRVPHAVCSPFAALSGRGDEFGSMDELIRSVRSGVLLDIACVPIVSMADRHGQVRVGVRPQNPRARLPRVAGSSWCGASCWCASNPKGDHAPNWGADHSPPGQLAALERRLP